MNIVSMAMGYLGPTIVSKVAKSMGMSDSIVTKMIGLALPSILGGLTGSSRSGAGAGALFDAVSKMNWGGGNSACGWRNRRTSRVFARDAWPHRAWIIA